MKELKTLYTIEAIAMMSSLTTPTLRNYFKNDFLKTQITKKTIHQINEFGGKYDKTI